MAERIIVKIPWYESWGRELVSGEVVRYMQRGADNHGLAWVASSSSSKSGYTTGTVSDWLVEVIALPETASPVLGSGLR